MFKKLILSISFFALVNAEDYSLKFDGLDDYIDFGTNSSTEISGDLSIVAWFKFDDFSNSLSTVLMKESTSLSDNNAYGINKTWNGNGLDFVVGDGNTTNIVSTQELQAEQWYHLVCTNDGNYSRVYVDGVMHNEIESGNPLAPNADLKIGLHSTISNQDRFWKGNIDDVSLWNVALSQEQVENLYQNNPLGTEQGLIAHWNFNEGSGPVTLDYSGNNNHGIIYGAEWSDDVPTMDPPQPPQGDYSLFFDGLGDYVELPTTTDLALTDGITLSAWIKIPLNQGNPWGGLIGGLDGYGYTLYAGSANDQGRLNLEIGGVGGGNVRSNTDLRDGHWHHVAVTCNGFTACAYVDGLKENESTFMASTANNGDNLGNEYLKFGHVNHNQSPAELFIGNISHISIHNIALGEDIIMGLAQGASYYNGLVGKWDFNEGEGLELTDVSGNNNHGIIIGADWSDDVPAMDPPPFEENHSLSFDGNGDYVDLGNSSSFDFQYGDPFTISMWIHPNSLGGDAGLISKMADGGPVQYDVITAGASIRYGTGDQFLFGGQLEVGNWYHLIVTSDGSAKNIYINNQLIESGTFESMTSNGDNLYIGAHQPLSMPGWSWNGFIDEVSIWNITLSQSEIEDNVTNDLNGSENGLVSYYKFNEGEGTTLTDLSGNGNHGTINGAEWSDDVPAMDPPLPPQGDNSLFFDGVGDYVDINVSISNDFSLMGWLNYENANNANAILASSSNDFLRLDQNKLGYNSPSGANHMGSTNLESLTWYHFAVVRSGDVLDFYINGINDGSFIEPESSLEWTKIGVYRDGYQHLFHGWLDDISIWNSALPIEQIQQHMNIQPIIWPEGPVAYWTFNQGGGWTLTDVSGNNNHGDIIGAEWSNNVPNMDHQPPPSEDNHSLSFDGEDDYVSIGESADFDVADELTIFATIKPESYDCASIIDRLPGSAGEGYRLNLRGNCSSENGVVWSAFGSASSSVVAQSDDSGYSLSEWVTITGVWKNNNYVKLYINGNLVESTFSDRSFDTDRPLEFARLGYDNTEYFNGLIDEVSIWNVALSESEINSYAFTQLGGNETNLVGYWNFNEGEGTTLTDLSGNGNHGIIYGAEWSGDGAPVMPSSIAALGVGTAQAAPNSEVLVPVFVDLMYESVSSVEISFSGFHDQMEFVGLETEGTMTGDAEWSSAVNSEEDLLLTLTYGANEIVGVGTLFHLRFQVLDNVTGEFIPVVIEYVQMDELDGHIDVMNGGVELYDLDWGDVSQNGEISGFDASLILKHLVGMEELDELQLTVADVTQDNTISALDASAIAQYVVNMIDELPVANMDAMTGRGNFYFEELSLVPGELLEVPIQLINGDNLLSFEMEVDYDQETFTLEELVWSDLIEHFTVEENLESGSVKIAGMGATPDGQEGVFGTIRFYVNPDFSDPNTLVNIGYRINEQSAVDDVNLVIQNAVLGLENEMIPNEFTIGQNYPNPFNPTTRIDYGLPQESMVDITIYDMMGRLVSKLVKSRLGAGYHSVTWDATNNAGDPVSAGMYFYTVQAGEYRVTNKMLLLK